jgi:hypothetical protein
VREAGWRLRLAEVGQIEGDRAHGAGHGHHRSAPVVDRAGIAVDEQHDVSVISSAQDPQVDGADPQLLGRGAATVNGRLPRAGKTARSCA